MTDRRPRTLTESLRTLDRDQLARLLRHRPDLAEPPPLDYAELAARAITSGSIGRALESLDAWQRTVAEALAALPDPASVADLTALLGRREPVATTVEELRARGLLWGADDALHLVRGAREAFDLYPGGLAPPSPRPLTDAEIDAALATLPDEARAALHRLVWTPTGAVRNATRAIDADRARAPVDILLSRRLLRPLDAETVIIPREVALRLRGGRFSAEPVPPTAPAVGGGSRQVWLVDRAGAGAAYGLLHDLELVAELLEQNSWSLLRTGGLATRDIGSLARALAPIPSTPGDPAYAVFLLECAAAAGLIAADGLRAVLPTRGYDRWVRRDPADRWRTLVAGWLDAPRFFARAADPGAHALGPEADAPLAPTVRRTVVEVAAAAGPGAIADRADLAAALAWHRPRLTRIKPDAATVVGWTWREMSWLGLVALDAVTSYAAVALTPDTAMPTALAELFPTTVQHLIVQTDLTAVAAGPLAPEVAAELRLLADQESRGGGGVYRFSASSLRRAFDRGRSSAQVLRWLEQHSSTGVPQPLAYLVADVARRHGSIRVGPAGSVLTVDDDAQLAALLASSAAGALGLRQIGPGVLAALVDEAELLGVLRDLGHTPVVEDETGQLRTAPPARRAPKPSSLDNPRPADPEQVAAALLDRSDADSGLMTIPLAGDLKSKAVGDRH